MLVGYSQGANVVDNSIGVSSDGAVVGGPIVATIPAEPAPRIAAVLLFGNPIRAIGRQVTGPYQSRTKDYCAAGPLELRRRRGRCGRVRREQGLAGQR